MMSMYKCKWFKAGFFSGIEPFELWGKYALIGAKIAKSSYSSLLSKMKILLLSCGGTINKYYDEITGDLPVDGSDFVLISMPREILILR